jgi:hypothetical protein
MIDFENKMRDCVKEVAKWGLKVADLKPQADYLGEMRKTVLSQEMLKQDPKLSLGEKEARARVSEAYMVHLQGQKEAEHQALVAIAKREAARSTFDALRSLCSLEKKHMETFEHEQEHET